MGEFWKLVEPGGTPLVLGIEESSARRETKKKCHEGTVRMGIKSHLKP